MFRVVTVIQIVLLCLSAIACGSGSPTSNANTAGEKTCDRISDTPAEAYKRLFAAVKEKNTEKIKGEMSRKTHELAEMMAGRQKKPVEEVFANGFTATTFSPALPEIRDERMTSCWAAVEVRNDKDQRWEDLPLVNEGGTWKFAFGEIFSGAYKSPGKGMDIKEKEAANTARGNIPMAPIGNANGVNANTNSPGPKYDGPQVEPMPKKK